MLNLTDDFGFLQTNGNWDNHRGLLLLGLSITEGKVIELGSGEGSTEYLRKYCWQNDREFFSFESNYMWAEKMKSIYVENWETDNKWIMPCGLLFVDHAPGEHRKEAIREMVNLANVIVIHDTEECGQGDYKFDQIWPLFKYRININKTAGGAGASMVSNKINLSIYTGHQLGQYTIE